MSVTVFLVAFLLAFANGANDNIKGAATLVGSGLVDARSGLWMATLTTAAGGLVSIVLSNGLLAAFGGRGLVPDALAGSADFLLPVGVAAASTVALATWLRMPVSTTHALVGALVGGGLVAAPDSVDLGKAVTGLAGPLLLVPAIAIALALGCVPLLRAARRRAQIAPDLCACEVAQAGNDPGQGAAVADLQIGRIDDEVCAGATPVVAVKATRWLDGAHLLSASAVSFARGLNDTPKIAAIALAGGGGHAMGASLWVVLAMALGGILVGLRVAETLAFRITRMDPGEGLAGNAVAAGLIMAASPLGLPVSTTHVTGSALFGVAASNRSGQVATIGGIATAWLLTLPVAAILATLSFHGFHALLSK